MVADCLLFLSVSLPPPLFTVFSSHQVAHDIKGKVIDKVQNGTLVIHFLILLFSIP